jgi:DNA-3-methyladenine glycosylase II
LATGRKRALLLIFRTPGDLLKATHALIVLEPKFGAVFDLHGLPSLRRTPANLESLLLIVTEQFLSLQAAAAIWERVKQRLGEVSRQSVLACAQAELVALGLSRSKATCFHGCASVDIDFENVETLRPSLLEIWGIGPWTADIFMLSAVGAADAWPAGDVALQASVQSIFGLPARPSVKEIEALSQNWRPYRAAAARLLWAHYRHLKALPQAPSQN